MYSVKVITVCLLITVTTHLSANFIADAVRLTQESVVQVCDDVISSELGVACVHTWDYFQAWVAQRPLQAGTLAGVIAFVTCYWLSKRSAEYRTMREQTAAYSDGFEDGYDYASRSYKNNIIWI